MDKKDPEETLTRKPPVLEKVQVKKILEGIVLQGKLSLEESGEER